MTVNGEAVAKAAQALGHPLRVRVVAALAEREKASPSELAGEFGAPLGNVSYHVRTLLALGVIERAGTRPVRGAVEHYYRLADGSSESLAALRDVTGRLLAAANQRRIDERRWAAGRRAA